MRHGEVGGDTGDTATFVTGEGASDRVTAGFKDSLHVGGWGTPRLPLFQDI
jgi:hypothetical protein